MKTAAARSILAVTALALGMAVYAADKKGGDGKVSNDDRDFITKAAEGGHAEVELGKVAQKNGGSDAVKQFGARMVADHGKSGKELEAIAMKLGVTPPKEPGKHHQNDMKKMMKMTGSEFDRDYAKHMVDDHEKTIDLFEKQAKRGDAQELKDFAAKTLPVLQEHLKMAKALDADTKSDRKGKSDKK